MTVATGGQEALELVRAEKPDLVLMDVQLPGLDGLSVTRLIKADPATRGIPVVALTAHAMRGDEAVISAAGCDHYLPKPIQIKLLRELLARYAGRRADSKSD